MVYFSLHSLLAPSTMHCNSGNLACKACSKAIGNWFRMFCDTSSLRARTWALLSAKDCLRPASSCGGKLTPFGLAAAAAAASTASFFSCSIFLYAVASCFSFFVVSFAFSSEASKSLRSAATSSLLAEAAGDGASVVAVAGDAAAAPSAFSWSICFFCFRTALSSAATRCFASCSSCVDAALAKSPPPLLAQGLAEGLATEGEAERIWLLAPRSSRAPGSVKRSACSCITSFSHRCVSCANSSPSALAHASSSLGNPCKLGGNAAPPACPWKYSACSRKRVATACMWARRRRVFCNSVFISVVWERFTC
mmetsp:Transcript_34641/g.98627  ORF Transcript_34641/g.98627 Transcript_34641/m.98627 type:complete len:309 (+) Transcript_34641:1301-2227(+)